MVSYNLQNSLPSDLMETDKKVFRKPSSSLFPHYSCKGDRFFNFPCLAPPLPPNGSKLSIQETTYNWSLQNSSPVTSENIVCVSTQKYSHCCSHLYFEIL